MDENKLNPRALAMAKDLMSVRTGLPLSSAIGAVNYKMSNIASQLQVRVNTMTGYSPATVNTYTLLLMNSGGGKNSSLGLLDRFFFGEAFAKVRDDVYPYFKKKAIAKLEEDGDDRPIHSWTQSISNATMSGMYAYAESFSLVGFGSLNIEVDEIGNAVTSKAELLENLLTPFDNGDFQPVAKRTDSNAMDISGLPVNLYSFGNKVRLFNGDGTESSFIHLLDEGYGRRFIFIDDNSTPKNKTPKEVLDEMKHAEQIRIDRATERVYIKNLIRNESFKSVLEFNDEAMLSYATIKSESDAIVNDTKGLEPAVIADLSERHFKTAKLAGVYAFFDESAIVTGKHMEQAYEVIKNSSQVLQDLRKVKPLHVRLVEKMLNERDRITAQTMLAYSFINSTWSKKIYEHIDLARQYSSSMGYEWDEVTREGVTYYMVLEDPKELEKEAEGLF